MCAINLRNLEDRMAEKRACYTHNISENPPNRSASKGNPCDLKHRSKSDSDLYAVLAAQNSAVRFKDYDDFSISPSDSIVTIVQMKRKSQTQNIITNRTRGGIFGDGSHLARSSSMVNLATTIQRDCGSCIPKEERLVSLSSWDGNEIPVSTVSDSRINHSPQTGSELPLSLLSIAAWNRCCLANKERRLKDRPIGTALVETQVEINKVPPRDQSLNNKNPQNSYKTDSMKVDFTAEDDVISCDVNVTSKHVDQSSIKRPSLKLSTRLQKAFQRVVCACLFRRIKKNVMK